MRGIRCSPCEKDGYDMGLEHQIFDQIAAVLEMNVDRHDHLA
jgi:hypothetical protein